MDHDHDGDEPQLNLTEEPKNTEFECPKDGKISRDDVIFLCNNCSKDDVVYKDGIYMCPSCLYPGENFECMICGSKKVQMKMKAAK